MENIPSYRKVYAALKQDIRDGIYQPGMLIPAEPELEKKYGVSRTTVRRAVELLRGEGYVRAKQGRGTEVLDISTTQRLNYITSITETLQEKGYEVTTQGMCIDRILAPQDVVEALEIPENETVFRLQRVQCIDGQPFCLMTNFLQPSLVPNFDKRTGEFVSLYKFLEKEYGLHLTSAVEKISAIGANFIESQMLRINLGAPLLYSKRITYTGNDPLEYAKIKLLAEKYQFSIYMQGRP